MKAIVASLLVAALALASAGALLTSVDAGQWLPVVVLAALAHLGTFRLYRGYRRRLDRPRDWAGPQD